MNLKEQQLLRIYFKSHVQLFLCFTAVFSIVSVYVLISSGLTTAILLILFFLIVLALCHGMYFFFWFRVQNELKQPYVEQKVITIQNVDLDHAYCSSLKHTPVIGDPKFILTDEHGDIYRMVADRSLLSCYYHGIVGETIEIRCLPKTRFLLSASLREGKNIPQKTKRDKKDLTKFLGPYLK